MRFLRQLTAAVGGMILTASAFTTALAEPAGQATTTGAAAPSQRPSIDWDQLYKYESRGGGSARQTKPYVAPRPFGQYGYYGGYYGNPYAGYPYYGYSIIGSPNLFPYYDYGRYFSGYYPGYGGYNGTGYYYDPGPVRWRSEERLGDLIAR